MVDQHHRDIHYLRISITDRCNLRCSYCMPAGVVPIAHSEVLRYEELLYIAEICASLGIRHIRVTGGEPLVRRGAVGFIAALKKLPGIERVSLTSNGILLAREADALREAGLDGVNVSLDTLDSALYAKITGSAYRPADVLAGVEAMRLCGIPAKLNAVLLEETASGLPELLRLAQEGIPLRFIELMPLGEGKCLRGLPAEEALSLIKRQFPDLRPVAERLGSGPAQYYRSAGLKAPVGVIAAVSSRFCADCNRVRLTSTGVLKSCLCFEEGVDVRGLLRGGASREQIGAAVSAGIFEKRKQHCFGDAAEVTEHKPMSQIGG